MAAILSPPPMCEKWYVVIWVKKGLQLTRLLQVYFWNCFSYVECDYLGLNVFLAPVYIALVECYHDNEIPWGFCL